MKGEKIKISNQIWKLNLEFSAAEGSLRIDVRNNVNLDNVILPDDKKDSMIYVKYCPEEKRYRYSLYKKKE